MSLNVVAYKHLDDTTGTVDGNNFSFKNTFDKGDAIEFNCTEAGRTHVYLWSSENTLCAHSL